MGIDVVDVLIRYYYVVSSSVVCGAVFCTSRNVVIGVCVVARVLLGSVGI
jgi:hypothetical protein